MVFDALSDAVRAAVGKAHPVPIKRRARLSFNVFGACRRRTPRTEVDQRVPKDASRRDLSDATLLCDLAPRRMPSASSEKVAKVDPRSGLVDFERVSIAAGGSATVRFEVPKQALALTTSDGSKKLYSGIHELVFSRGNGVDVKVEITV